MTRPFLISRFPPVAPFFYSWSAESRPLSLLPLITKIALWTVPSSIRFSAPEEFPPGQRKEAGLIFPPRGQPESHPSSVSLFGPEFLLEATGKFTLARLFFIVFPLPVDFWFWENSPCPTSLARSVGPPLFAGFPVVPDFPSHALFPTPLGEGSSARYGAMSPGYSLEDLL